MDKKISMEGQYFSQFGEDKWIVDNLRYPLKGIFVDVGQAMVFMVTILIFLKR
jgi:hypothetical protein